MSTFQFHRPTRGKDHVHKICLDNLIVHKYADSPALFHKADKVAREIIENELREGEYARFPRAGLYHIYLPKLLPEAGELRVSIIADHIFRAVRDFNPTAIQIRDVTESCLRSDVSSRLRNNIRVGSWHGAQALKMMSNENLSYEELMDSPLGKMLAAELKMGVLPVWNTKSHLISAFECLPMLGGALLSKKISDLYAYGMDTAQLLAIVDTVTFMRIGSMLKKSAAQQQKAVLVCPVHASTLEHSRFAGGFLACGRDIPRPEKSIVFLVKDLHEPISRLRTRDLARYLHTRCRGIVAEMHFDAPDIGFLKDFGFHSVRASALENGITEQQFLVKVNDFAERCEKAHLESFVGEVETNSVAVTALASGCTYLSGPAIARHSSHKGQVEAFELDSLYDFAAA